MPDIVSDPMGQLPQRLMKYAVRCSELHLGNMNISVLDGFAKFTNLECLWLNNNRLTNLNNLDCGFGLNHLYCHNNRIKYLTDNVNCFPFLKTLTVSNNCLDDINEVIEELRCLRHLRTLDLSGNPIAKEDNYRLRIISEIPWLVSLDTHNISDMEKEDAKLYKKRESRRHLIKPKKRITKQELADLEEKDKALQNVLQKLRPIACQRRCRLQLYFVEFDPRKLGFITESDFRKVLQRFNLLTTDDDYELLLDRFHIPVKIEAISASGTITKQMVAYNDFCLALLPIGLLHEPTVDYTTPVPELSSTALDLQRFVKSIKQRKKSEEEDSKRNSILSLGASKSFHDTTFSSLRSSAGSVEFQPTLSAYAASDGPAHPGVGALTDNNIRTGLDPWEFAEVARMVRELRERVGENVSVDDVEELLRGISGMGKTPRIGEIAARNLIYSECGYSATSGGSGSSSGSGSGNGKPVLALAQIASVLGLSQVESGKSKADNRGKGASKHEDKSGRRSSAITSATASSASSPVKPVISWRPMQSTEAMSVESFANSCANESFELLLRSQSQTSAEGLALSSTAMRSALAASRLHAMHTRQSPLEHDPDPYEVIRKAPLRADALVLPNLKRNGTVLTLTSTPMAASTTALRNSKSANSVIGTGQSSDHSDLADWARAFSDLGLKGDKLKAALDRKQRSLLSLSVKQLNEGKGNERSALPPAESVRMKTTKNGWAKSTGTIIF